MPTGTQPRVHQKQATRPRPAASKKAGRTRQQYNGTGTSAGNGSTSTPPHDPLSALQKVVHQCSQAIIRGYDEQSILNESCRLLVEETGYAMSWIAQRKNGDDQEITPLAQTGVPGDFQPPGRNGTTWSDPLQNALATQRPQVVRNIQNNTNHKSLREHADRWGYASQCTIPLRLQPDSLGALTIYSKESDAFGPQELVLLRELAGDLEHGIANLQEQAQLEHRESELREARKHYVDFFENAREAIFTTSPGGTIKLANRAFAELMGFPEPGKLLNERSISLYTILTPRDKNRLMQSVEDETQTPLEMELLRPNRPPAWVAVNAQRTNTPEGPRIKVFVRDLSPQRTEREKEKRLLELVESRHTAIINKDLDGRIRDWNRGAEELYGIPADQVIGRPDSEVNLPGDRLEHEKRVAEAVRNGKRVPPYQTRRRHQDGSMVDVCVTVNPTGPPGPVTGYWSIEHEIARNTERGNGARPAHAKSVVTSTTGPRSGLIQPAMHALNSTVTPIINHVELARSKWPDSVDKDHLAHIERNAFHLARLVKELEEAFRLESGAIELDRQPTPLKNVIDDALGDVEETTRQRGIRIEQEAPPSWIVLMDRARVRQALSTLIEQAVLASPKGRTMRLRTIKTKQNVRIQIAGASDPLEAKRDGAEDDREARTLHATAKRTGELRLYVAKKIIEHHGGRLGVNGGSKQDPATMNLVLPIEGDGQKEPPAAREKPMAARHVLRPDA